jgi:hypothetical protein
MRNPGIGLHEVLAGIRRDDKSGRDGQPGGYQLPELSRLAADARNILETTRAQRHREYARLARSFQTLQHC